MSIFIFSKPIHSGKTSLLMDWCGRKKNCAGILMPDINGRRKMYTIESGEFFDAECEPSSTENENMISVGRYFFYAAAFKKANTAIISALNKPFDWLIIDEVGKLEIARNGFYTAVNNAVEAVAQKTFTGNILFVVRDTMVEDVVEKFGIEKYEVIDSLPD